MNEFIHHWLYLDLYTPLWPNIAASILLGVVGFLYGRAFERRARIRHEDVKAHITMEHLRSRDHLEKLTKGKL